MSRANVHSSQEVLLSPIDDSVFLCIARKLFETRSLEVTPNKICVTSRSCDISVLLYIAIGQVLMLAPPESGVA
jgi:hypothetical protein